MNALEVVKAIPAKFTSIFVFINESRQIEVHEEEDNIPALANFAMGSKMMGQSLFWS